MGIVDKAWSGVDGGETSERVEADERAMRVERTERVDEAGGENVWIENIQGERREPVERGESEAKWGEEGGVVQGEEGQGRGRGRM